MLYGRVNDVDNADDNFIALENFTYEFHHDADFAQQQKTRF